MYLNFRGDLVCKVYNMTQTQTTIIPSRSLVQGIEWARLRDLIKGMAQNNYVCPNAPSKPKRVESYIVSPVKKRLIF